MIPRTEAPIRLLSAPPSWPEGRHAAVLLSLWPPPAKGRPGGTPTPFSRDWRLLYIVRGLTGGKHDGQIAFPGGALDAADAGPSEAALREAREELGIDSHALRVQGFMTALAIPVSGFAVIPVVALADRPQPDLQDAPDEVSGHFFVPLRTLAEVRATEPFVRAGRKTIFPVFRVSDPHGPLPGTIRIWGATAWMTANLLDRLPAEPP